MARQQPSEEKAWEELLPLLDQELSRLPDKYRIPVILCELEGKSRQEAARQLGLPEGTLSSRLARARAILARRLTQRGLTLTGGALAVGLSQHATSAVVPPSLIVSTVKAGTLVLAGPSAAAGVVSAHVAALSEGVVKTMFLSKLKIATAALLLGSVFAIGTSEATRHVWAARSAQVPQERAEKDSQASGTTDSERANPQSPFGKSALDTKSVVQLALETVEAITDPLARVRTLLRIAAVQRNMGQTYDARKTRQAALEFAKNLADNRSKAVALVEVAFAQAEDDGRSAALDTLRQAEEAAAALQDVNRKSIALLQVVRAQVLLEDYEGALRTAASMKDFEMDGLRRIAEYVYVRKFIGQGGHGYVRKDSGQAGREALKQVLDRAKTIIGSKPIRSNIFLNIAYAYARMGDIKAALQVADSVHKLDKDSALQSIL